MPIDFNSFSATPSSQAREAGLRGYMHAVYGYMTGGLALTGVVAYYSFASGIYLAIAKTPLIWVVLLAPLAMVMLLGFRIQKMSLTAAQMTYWGYAALMGLSLGGIFMMFTGESISRVFFITAGTFGVMSVYGYSTKRDLTKLGSFMMMGLIGVGILGLVEIFLSLSELQFLFFVIGVIVFFGLAAYEPPKIRALFPATDAHEIAGKKEVFGALMLYLDFINLFLLLLQLFGNTGGGRR